MSKEAKVSIIWCISLWCIIVAFLLVSVSCNRQVLDTTYSFDYAYIRLANGEVVEGEVDSWKDYEDGDQLQVVIDGVTYLTHSSNVTLISHKG